MQISLFSSKNIPCLLVLVFSIIINNPAQSHAERIRKVAIMGNSFSIHPITDYWWGEWGMAATHRDSDYCHVLQKLITNWQGEEPELAIHNIADFERGHGKDEVRQQTAEKLTGAEDLIILRIGECVSNYVHYTEDLEALIDRIKFRSPGAKIVMSGCFWPSHKRDSSQLAASTSKNCIWCPLRQLCSSETLATLDDRVFGDDYLWHFIKEGGQ